MVLPEPRLTGTPHPLELARQRREGVMTKLCQARQGAAVADAEPGSSRHGSTHVPSAFAVRRFAAVKPGDRACILRAPKTGLTLTRFSHRAADKAKTK